MLLTGRTTARTIRNEASYDDWDYGTEPIPMDTSWVVPHDLTQLITRLVDAFDATESINHTVLARVAIHELLKLPEAVLLQLRSQHPYHTS